MPVFLFVIWFSVYNAVPSVNLFQQNHPHQLMGKRHFRKADRKVSFLTYREDAYVITLEIQGKEYGSEGFAAIFCYSFS